MTDPATPFFSGSWFAPEFTLIADTKARFPMLSPKQPAPVEQLEDRLTESPISFVALDEVGRGSVAGPVVVGATLWWEHRSLSELCCADSAAFMDSVTDSKKLSEQKRGTIYDQTLAMGALDSVVGTDRCASHRAATATHPRFHCSHNTTSLQKLLKTYSRFAPRTVQLKGCFFGGASPREIEKHNIWGATQLAICRALHSLNEVVEAEPAAIIFDGHLRSRVPKSLQSVPFITLTKADQHLKSVALSSILAKVSRDRELILLDAKHPEYGFARHKGYGTAAHLEAIAAHGVLPAHRSTFLKKNQQHRNASEQAAGLA